ncbi:putative sensory transduction regulator [Salmonella enterica subsp. enterica]|uniref:Putative sensory transduction regulator n=1 Tax=Salmonella enterica I TaxID=59201 RepID=A0A3S4F8D8_SALET|nr:putative sensory transduction regulator [Salmonella enterica subsp. enterica]
MISLVVPTLDTLRQWLDDLGMNFFECDTCQGAAFAAYAEF